MQVGAMRAAIVTERTARHAHSKKRGQGTGPRAAASE